MKVKPILVLCFTIKRICYFGYVKTWTNQQTDLNWAFLKLKSPQTQKKPVFKPWYCLSSNAKTHIACHVWYVHSQRCMLAATYLPGIFSHGCTCTQQPVHSI